MKDIIPNMLELAFIALENGDLDKSDKIFQALKESIPNDAIGSIGMASVSIARGEIPAAIQELESDALNKEINQTEARKLLLAAAMLSGDNDRAHQVHEHFIVNNICPAHQPEQSKHLTDAEQFFSA